MQLVQSKSILAKLMATENIIVEQRKVRTASFDVANRVLTVPILDDKISPELYDLFMGHEVGHALYSPEEMFDLAKERKLTFSVMNVVEDAKIEKKIKSKYPGLKQPFIIGYKDLLQRNFFGLDDRGVNDLNFVDRANIHFKIGVAAGVIFINETELYLIDKIDNVETVEDVLTTTKEIMDYLIEENKKPLKGDGEDDLDADEYEDDCIESETDNALNQNQSKLHSSENLEYYYGNIPKLSPGIIIDHQTIWDRYDKWVNYLIDNRAEYDARKERYYQTFRNDSKKVVSYLVKEFELRKNAEQLKRASTAKSGELNMDAIYSYKISEDIFKKLTILPGGKSHGLVMFLDWSGSMHGVMHNTVKQLLNLVFFCKKVNIPYEVYAFTTKYDDKISQPFNEGDIELFSGVNMMNMLSSKMTTSRFHYAASTLFNATKFRYYPTWMCLNSTPLNAAIVTAMTVVPKFKSDNKLQIVNTVFLTDGESNPNYLVHFMYDGLKSRGKTNYPHDECDQAPTQRSLIIRDPKTKNQETVVDIYDYRSTTTSYLKLLKSITNCNIIGFHIVESGSISGELCRMYPHMVHDKIKANFKKTNHIIVENNGYDEYYLIRAEGMKTEQEELTLKENATTRGLVSSFSKFHNKRTSNRIILSRFITMIT